MHSIMCVELSTTWWNLFSRHYVDSGGQTQIVSLVLMGGSHLYPLSRVDIPEQHVN